VFDLTEPREREGAAPVVAEPVAHAERRAVVGERLLGRAHEEVDAAEVVEGRRDAGRVAGHVEELPRELEVRERLLRRAQRAVQAPEAAVRRAALRRQVEAPGEAQHVGEVPDGLARAPEARRDVAHGVEGVHLGDRVVELEEAQGGQVEHVRPVEQEPRPRVVGRRDVAVGGASRVARAS
jgi:hypothetical protein